MVNATTTDDQTTSDDQDVYSSPAYWAERAAEALREGWGVRYEFEWWLWNPAARPERLTRTMLVVAVLLASHSDSNGISAPGRARLVRELRLSERTVKRALKNLREAGVIQPVTTGVAVHEEGGRAPQEYQLMPPSTWGVGPRPVAR